MGIEIRQATADEMAEFGILGGYVYGGAFGDGPDNLIELLDDGVQVEIGLLG